jgi:hypothetical protein
MFIYLEVVSVRNEWGLDIQAVLLPGTSDRNGNAWMLCSELAHCYEPSRVVTDSSNNALASRIWGCGANSSCRIEGIHSRLLPDAEQGKGLKGSETSEGVCRINYYWSTGNAEDAV